MLNSGLPAEGNQLLHAVRIAICEFRQVGEFGDDLAAFVPIDDPEPQNFLRFLQPLKFEKKLPVFGFPVPLEQNAVRRVGGRKFHDFQLRHGPRHLFPDSLEKVHFRLLGEGPLPGAGLCFSPRPRIHPPSRPRTSRRWWRGRGCNRRRSPPCRTRPTVRSSRPGRGLSGICRGG